jgi:hypothetical protein
LVKLLLSLEFFDLKGRKKIAIGVLALMFFYLKGRKKIAIGGLALMWWCAGVVGAGVRNFCLPVLQTSEDCARTRNTCMYVYT